MLSRAAFPRLKKGIMDNQAILVMAMEALEMRKAAIDAQIIELRGQIKGGIPGRSQAAAPAGKSMTVAQRAAQSKRMKAIWRLRKAGNAKAVKKASPEKGPKSAAARKAQSARMKAYWAKKKAAAKK